jgi:hypothetical protein
VRPERVELPTFWFVVRFSVCGAFVFNRLAGREVYCVLVVGLSREGFVQCFAQSCS